MFSYLLVICAKELLVCDVLVFWLERLKNLNSKPGCPNGVGDDEGDVVGMMVGLCRSTVMRWIWGWKWGDFEPGGVGKYEMGWKCGVFQPIFMDDTPERGPG